MKMLAKPALRLMSDLANVRSTHITARAQLAI